MARRRGEARAGIPVVLAGVAGVMVLSTAWVALSVPQSLVDAHELVP